MATNYNTGRTGWNRRGPSDKDMLAVQRRVQAEHPDNSDSWRTLALAATEDLAGLIGPDACTRWVDVNIPDCGTTWKENFLRIEGEYERRIGVQR